MDKVKERTGIYHEHQEGALCAQHAMNNLLQNPFFSADDLAVIARDLDVEEKSVLTDTSSISENMDDTGFFSIQVLQRALKTYDLELVPIASQEPIAQQARNAPQSIEAYICNLGLHWFTIRRFGRQYFDLNSMFYAPKFLKNSVLGIYLDVIRENGYSVFIVNGSLPYCLANEQLSANPISEAEYELLIKDLPRFIMDGKTMGSSKDINKRRKIFVQLRKDLYNEFEKNPNNPKLRELIYSQIPKDMLVDNISEHTDCSNPECHRHSDRHILVVLESDDEDLMGVCDFPLHRQQSQGPPRQRIERVINDHNINNPNERQHEPKMITQHVTQLIISRRDPNNPNAPVQQQVITTQQITVMNRSSNINNPSIDNRDNQRMIKPDIDDKDFFLEEAMNRSLLDTSEMNNDMNHFLTEERIKKLNQELLDEAIAASLITCNSQTKSIEQTPEAIPITNVDTPAAQTVHSEPEIIKMPPSLTVLSTSPTDTHSSPPINAHTSPSADNNSSPSTNVYTPPPTNTSSPLSMNTNSESPINALSFSSTTTNSLPSTVTDSELVVSPTVEEFRQRRLQFFGNRDRSIISVQSNFDD